MARTLNMSGCFFPDGKNDLKPYLLEKWRDIDVQLAQLLRLARQLVEKKMRHM